MRRFGLCALLEICNTDPNTNTTPHAQSELERVSSACMTVQTYGERLAAVEEKQTGKSSSFVRSILIQLLLLIAVDVAGYNS